MKPSYLPNYLVHLFSVLCFVALKNVPKEAKKIQNTSEKIILHNYPPKKAFSHSGAHVAAFISPKWAISIWLTLGTLVTHGKLLWAKMSSYGIEWKRWVPLNESFCKYYLKISFGVDLGPCCGLCVPLMGHICITDPCTCYWKVKYLLKKYDNKKMITSENVNL